MNLSVLLSGFFGVVIGCLTTGFGFLLARRYDRQVKHRQRELEHRVKEIDTLNLLNKKINQILQKRTLLMPDYVSFDVFDDVHVSIDDYAYLESFTAQNLFYLPNYVMEEFFKNISHRRIILSPEETVQIGGYTFKNGRVIMEQLSDEIQTMMNEKKTQLKKVSALPIHILRDEEYEFYN